METKTNTAANIAAPKWVAYTRRSTSKQGITLEKQLHDIRVQAEAEGAEIIAEIEETESGEHCDRAGLRKAMATARKHGAVIVAAKHDRITRDLGFASDLIFKSGVKFRLLDFPPVAMENAIVFGVFYGAAQDELKKISIRTKAALAQLKANGAKLGRPDAATSCTAEMTAKSVEVRRRKADENPRNIAAANELRRYFSEGIKKNLSAAARHLNDMALYTSTGTFHTAMSVKLLCTRYAI